MFKTNCCCVIANSNNLICQFNILPEELINYEKNNWCIFHLPITLNGTQSEKATWCKQTLDNFNIKFNKLLKSGFNNFYYVIFPTKFKLYNSRRDKHSLLVKKGTFYGNLSLASKIFRRKIKFENTVFYGTVDCTNTKFIKKLKFYNCIFYEKIIFKNSTIKNGNFSFSKFHNKITFQGSNFYSNKKRKLKFISTLFKSDADFQNCIFNCDVSFENGLFCLAPNFSAASFFLKLNFQIEKNFKDRSNIIAMHAYRNLRLIMQKQKAYEDEELFYFLEQKSKYSRLPILEKCISFLYRLFSDYGQSIKKPLLAFLIILALFIIISSTLASPSFDFKQPINWNLIEESFNFSLQKILYIGNSFLESTNNFYIKNVLHK